MLRKPAVLLVLAVILGAAAGGWAMHRLDARPDSVVAAFHRLYHQRGATTYNNTRWLGTLVQQLPLDLWSFQEIVYETRPDVLVEAGTFHGGSALYYASIFDFLGHGRVITIDIEAQPDVPKHPRITYILGSSTSPETFRKVQGHIQPGEKVMVILDSDHHAPHVLNELNLYHPLVSPGCYVIVQDTHFNNHPILPHFGPGPYEAVQEFLKTGPPFVADRSREKFLMSFNYGGFLKRVR
jgi:cephalosporin hydroxylase